MPTDHALSGGNGSNLSEDDSHDGYSSSLESEGMDLDELEQMNVDEGDDGAVTSVWDGRAKSARAWEREWAHFVSFFEEYAEVLMDGARDAGDYLVKTGPHISYGTACAYLLWRSAGIHGYLEERGTVNGFLTCWSSLKSYYSRKRGEGMPSEVTTGISEFWKTLRDDEELTSAMREKVILNADGIKALIYGIWAEGVWDSSSISQRWLTTFWIAIAIQSSLRGASLLPNDETDPAHLTYSHLKLVLIRVDDGPNTRCGVALLLRPRSNKNETSEDTWTVLRRTADRFRCPVSAVLAIAAHDRALPEGFSETDFSALHTIDQVLGNTSVKILDFKEPDKVVFKTQHLGAVVPWTEHRIGDVLSRLSRRCGFDRSVTPGSFRYLGVQSASLAGTRLEDIELNIGHLFGSAVTDRYLRLLPASDVGASVWGTAPRLSEALNLHPNVTRPAERILRLSQVEQSSPGPESQPRTTAAYLKHVRRVLFSPGQLDASSALLCATALPNPDDPIDFLPSGFQWSHGQPCPHCGHKFSKTKSHEHSHVREHAEQCTAKSKLVEATSDLTARYPVQPPLSLHPCVAHAGPFNDPDKKPRKDKYHAANTRWDAAQAVWIIPLESNKLVKAMEHLFRKDGYLRCAQCGYTAFSLNMAKSHALCHGLWTADLPGATAVVKEFRNDAQADPGAGVKVGKRLVTLLGFEPFYSWNQDLWIVDPLLLEQHQQREYERRIGCHLTLGIEYHLNPTLDLSDLQRQSLKSDMKPGEVDNKYNQVAVHARPVEQQLCILCCAMTAEPFAIRMRPTSPSHVRLHVATELHFALRGKECLLYRGGHLVCPDPVCLGISKTFTDPLSLLWHLAGVHGIALKPPPSRQLGLDDMELSDLTMATQSELNTLIACRGYQYEQHPPYESADSRDFQQPMNVIFPDDFSMFTFGDADAHSYDTLPVDQ